MYILAMHVAPLEHMNAHSCQPSRSARESPADQALSRVLPDIEILQWIVPMAAFQSRE